MAGQTNADKNSDGGYVSIPVAELDVASARLDTTADQIDTSRRRLERETASAVLNREDPTFSPSQFRSRLAASVEGLRRTAAQTRATAGLIADTAVAATESDAAGPELEPLDSVRPVNDVVDQLATYSDGGNATAVSDPGWEQAWQAANQSQP